MCYNPAVNEGVFCLNPDCRIFNQPGQGNIVKFGVYLSKQGGRARYLCKACGKTFSERANSRSYGLHAAEETILKLLSEHKNGKSLNRISRETGIKTDTLRAWRKRFGDAPKEAGTPEDRQTPTASVDRQTQNDTNEMVINGLSPNLKLPDLTMADSLDVSFSINWASIGFLMWMMNYNHSDRPPFLTGRTDI